MRTIKNILFSVTLLLVSLVSAQTVQLPDTNLRNRLISAYPQVMQGNELDITEAAKLSGTLDLRNSNITDASGIEYFTNIITLDLTDNKLSTIPDISATTGLNNFYATRNQLVSLPDMSMLTQLSDFQVMHNQLTALPKLSIGNNLRLLYCSSNKITQFPDFSNFPALVYLVIGDNPVTHSIDVSTCRNITQLHVHKMGLSEINGLSNLSNLSVLYAWGNNISDFSGLDSLKSTTKLYLYNNPIADLPYLNNKSSLNTLDIHNCSLTFEDIVPVLKQFPTASIRYAPQALIQMNDLVAREKKDLKMSFPINYPIVGSVYAWLKDSILLDSSTIPSYTIRHVAKSDTGSYLLRVSHPDAPQLLLSSNLFRVTEVLPCIEFELPVVDITSEDCSKGYTIDLSNASIAGGTEPLTYLVTSSSKRMKFTDDLLEGIPAGKHEISVIDANKCIATVQVTLNRIEGCDPVFTPNGDGIADNYFIETTGIVNIYDLQRKLVRTLSAPVVWDGKDQHGNLLDAGYYILIPDGAEPIYITLIR